MKSSFPLFPDSASSLAGDVDALYLVWVVISVFFTLLIAGLILFLMARYRRRDPDDVGANEAAPVWLEIAWSAIPLAITLVMFAWGTLVFFNIYRPPQDAVEYTAIGRQWMWKIQHPEGQREINTLHVPLGQSVRMKLASEDVIHSFYIPAFRVKQDVVPGRYTSLWFRATKPGVYHLFCAEYCGAEHSKMVGSVIVMEPQDYENWLSGGTGGKSMVVLGRRALPVARLRHLPRRSPRAHPARAVARRRLRPPGGSRRRPRRPRRRQLHPGVDPHPHGQGGRRLRSGDAHLPGAGERGAALPARRLRPLAGRHRQLARGRHGRAGGRQHTSDCASDCGHGLRETEVRTTP